MPRQIAPVAPPAPTAPRAFYDASVFLSMYTMDDFREWAERSLEDPPLACEPVTCDLCVGEIVTNIVEQPHIGVGIWHAALTDLTNRLARFEILRVRSQTSRCARKVHDILTIQYKDKVWVTTALDDRVTHLFTTDRGVFDNRTQLTAASQAIGGQAVKVHSPYR